MSEQYDCEECKESLYGRKFILREDKPHCITCYERLFSNSCDMCKELIGCTGTDLTYMDRHWHHGCFLCTTCSRSLVDRPFSARDEQLMCIECFSSEFSSKCHECLKTIMPGTKKLENKGRSWHESCFTCHQCQQPIGTQSFLQKDDNNYCMCCYEKNFALQCIHCTKPITSGGVTYRDQPWHKVCFVCTGCKEPLSGQRFTSRDDVTYCLSCFCNLFSKKCVSCSTPISGAGGSKYVSFEERQWHNDCFNCQKCSVSLIGRGFATARDDVYCPDCSKDV
ncbi:four and a half LIM domains protein 2-like [Diretmus argenteus]